MKRTLIIIFVTTFIFLGMASQGQAQQTNLVPYQYQQLIKRGQQGDHITILQNCLLSMGHELPRFGADGDYGSETLLAIIQLQLDNDIKPDGVVGPMTAQYIQCGVGGQSMSTNSNQAQITNTDINVPVPEGALSFEPKEEEEGFVFKQAIPTEVILNEVNESIAVYAIDAQHGCGTTSHEWKRFNNQIAVNLQHKITLNEEGEEARCTIQPRDYDFEIPIERGIYSVSVNGGAPQTIVIDGVDGAFVRDYLPNEDASQGSRKTDINGYREVPNTQQAGADISFEIKNSGEQNIKITDVLYSIADPKIGLAENLSLHDHNRGRYSYEGLESYQMTLTNEEQRRIDLSNYILEGESNTTLTVTVVADAEQNGTGRYEFVIQGVTWQNQATGYSGVLDLQIPVNDLIF